MKKSKLAKLILISLIAILGVFSVCFEDVINSNINRYLYSRGIYQPKDELSIHFIDVGEADAIAINFPNGEVGMIDTGDENSAQKVMSYIDQYIVNTSKHKKIDYLFFTHCDSDHIGGLKRIVNNYQVKNIYRPRQFCSFETTDDKNAYISTSEIYADTIKTIHQTASNLITIWDGMEFCVGQTSIQIFASNKRYVDSNDYSYFIKLTYNNQSILFTGDASSVVENDVIELYGNALKSDYLKVAHHGSKFSTSLDFLSYVQPKVAIISVGINNYGHPAEETLARLSQCGTKIYRTDIDSSVLINMGQSAKILKSSYAKDNFYLNCGSLCIIIEIFDLIVIQKEFVLAIKNRKKLKKLLTKV